MAVHQQYKIAAGYNVAAVSLVNIESISVGGKKFVAMRSFGTHDPGVLRVLGDGTDYAAGFKYVEWWFAGVTFAQYLYLKTTYAAGGYRGKVTINVKIDDIDTYVRRNAIIVLPKEAELEKKLNAYSLVKIGFVRVKPTS